MTELGLILGIGVIGLSVASVLARHVLSLDAGTLEMRRISDAIRTGAEAFLRRQNRTIAPFVAALACVVFALYAFLRPELAIDAAPRLELAGWMTLSLVLGALCSVAAGQAGMWISLRANLRAAAGARTSVSAALLAALRGGAVAGLFVVSLSVLGIAGLFLTVYAVKGGFSAEPDVARKLAAQVPLMIAGYGLGASVVALFAQVGGGIYTKAADVGADLMGKTEAAIAEDDPRNPAVIADLVGDNVGDCAGRGADLFESISAENIGAMILAASLYQANSERLGNALGVLLFPLVANAFGILAAIVGVFVVNTDGVEEPMTALNRGFFVAAVLSAAGFAGTSIWLLGPYWLMFFLCGVIGLCTSLAFVYITLYYTDGQYGPARAIARASQSGPAPNVIQGLSVGMESVVLPVLVVACAILVSYKLGERSGLEQAGLFGIAVAVMGMLGTAGYVLAMDTFAPITDNAGGVVDMSIAHTEPASRASIERLEAAGSTTKALTKGYAVGSAALAAFLLFSAVIEEVNKYAQGAGRALHGIDLSKPAVFVGAMVGAMLVFWFSSMCLSAVGRSAQEVIREVRRQFSALEREDGAVVFPDGYSPDYGACVDIVTRDALKQMIAPGVVALLTPVLLGLAMKWLIRTDEDPLLAAESVTAFLMVGTCTGILLALALNNAGGAWSSSKKLIERASRPATSGTVAHDALQAAVVGDAVGDPFKDTAGPSLHVLIKLLATATLVLVPLFL